MQKGGFNKKDQRKGLIELNFRKLGRFYLDSKL